MRVVYESITDAIIAAKTAADVIGRRINEVQLTREEGEEFCKEMRGCLGTPWAAELDFRRGYRHWTFVGVKVRVSPTPSAVPEEFDVSSYV